ncbi:hypothetical protein AV544_08450 [Pediococcus acidilactici]|nr:hypothetical protein AV544_08450 [Pediococcus acidilactici]
MGQKKRFDYAARKHRIRALIAVLAIEVLIWLPEEVGAEKTFRLCSRKAQNQGLNHGLGD